MILPENCKNTKRSAVSALLFVCFFVEKRSNSLLANVKNAYIV